MAVKTDSLDVKDPAPLQDALNLPPARALLEPYAQMCGKFVDLERSQAFLAVSEVEPVEIEQVVQVFQQLLNASLFRNYEQ